MSAKIEEFMIRVPRYTRNWVLPAWRTISPSSSHNSDERVIADKLCSVRGRLADGSPADDMVVKVL